jgi:beta-xylosidase/AraC-like DNA-binding protein
MEGHKMSQINRTQRVKIEIINSPVEEEHFHQDFELLYVLAGTLELKQKDGSSVLLGPEDIILINANKSYYSKPSADILAIRLVILYSMVSDVFSGNGVTFWCNSVGNTNGTQYKEIRLLMNRLLNHYISSRKNVADFGHIALCYQIVDCLTINFLVQRTDKRILTEQDKFEDRIAEINSYINANYSQSIGIKELADKMFLSNGYLSRFFKKNYGMRFDVYLTRVRLSHAMEDVLYTEFPITRIAYNNGFQNLARFNKCFKEEYGESPTSLRKKYMAERTKAVTDEGVHEADDRLEEFLKNSDLPEKESAESRSCMGNHSVRTMIPLKRYWNRMINGGSASDLLRSDVQRHVIMLKTKMDFTYLRIWTLFTPQLYVDVTDQSGNYNFSKLDALFDFLLELGIRPHVELGNKPHRLQKNIQETLAYESPEQLYPTLEQWNRLMNSFMRHLISRYGRDEIDVWRMELWFPEDRWDMEDSVSEYIEFFESTYKIIRRYSSALSFGGSGIRMSFKGNMPVDHFLAQWALREIKPDFISALFYSYEMDEVGSETYVKRNPDNDACRNMAIRLQEMLRTANMEIPHTIVTEWNLSVSDRNAINDSTYKGAYIIKNILDMYGEAEEVAYFHISDLTAEHYDTSSLLFGGNGLITKDNIFKPSGFAFDFLNRLYPYYVGKGENYLITTNRTDAYGIICHNQKKLNYNYYYAKEDEISREHIWRYFSDQQPLDLNLSLCDVEDGLYKVKIYRVNRTSGVVLALWEEMNFETDLSRDDIKYFRKACEPNLSIFRTETAGGKLKLHLNLMANEIMFVHIRRILSL